MSEQAIILLLEIADRNEEIERLKTILSQCVEDLEPVVDELCRITGDVGFEPDRFRERMRATTNAGIVQRRLEKLLKETEK